MDTKLKVITMNKIILILIIASMFFTKGYAQQAEVLTLGVFHFEFPNLDVQQVSEEDQIDVLSPQYQREIELISKKLAQFKPDAIVIECPLYKQSEIDSLYNSYLTGKHELNRNEIQQLGFRKSISDCLYKGHSMTMASGLNCASFLDINSISL